MKYELHATIIRTGKVLMFNSSSGDYPELVHGLAEDSRTTNSR